MAITLDRKSPGIVGILFGAALSIAFGGLLAIVHLAAQPVEVATSVPKEPAEDVRYFIQGAPGGGAGKSWESKQDQIQSGTGEVGLTEAELNAWAGATFKPVEVDKEEKAGSFMIIAGVPNFRVVGKELQVGTVNTVNFFGSEGPLVLQARGGFVRAGGGWTFKPSEAYLGGLPLHRIPALLPVVAERLGVGKTPPAAVDTILKRATDISVQGDELVVRMP
jgi:hypothetical protein